MRLTCRHLVLVSRHYLRLAQLPTEAIASRRAVYEVQSLATLQLTISFIQGVDMEAPDPKVTRPVAKSKQPAKVKCITVPRGTVNIHAVLADCVKLNITQAYLERLVEVLKRNLITQVPLTHSSIGVSYRTLDLCVELDGHISAGQEEGGELPSARASNTTVEFDAIAPDFEMEMFTQASSGYKRQSPNSGSRLAVYRTRRLGIYCGRE